MIVADTSALVAVLFNEPERDRFRARIETSGRVLVSTVSVVETRIVAHGRLGPRAVLLADDLLALPMFEVVPPGVAEMEAAYRAFAIFGKGTGHPARLNFGDLFSYALAKVRGLPLLFKGDDFVHTNLIPAST